MSRVFVPVDVDFPTDPKVLQAGPAAAYLYLVALCYCKRMEQDGIIYESQLPLISVGMRAPKQLVSRLIATELWHKCDEGWQIPAWRKHNDSAERIKAKREMASHHGALGAHLRWHIPPEGTPSHKCPICIEEYIEAMKADGVPHGGGQWGRIAKKEIETRESHREDTDRTLPSSVKQNITSRVPDPTMGGFERP